MSKKVGPYVVIGFGLINILGGLGSGLIIQALFGVGITYIGWRLYNRSQKQIASSQQRQVSPSNFELTDELIVRLAKRLGGRLSVDDLASQTSLNRQQATERLESLHQKGVCNINLDEIGEDGKVYYNF